MAFSVKERQILANLEKYWLYFCTINTYLVSNIVGGEVKYIIMRNGCFIILLMLGQWLIAQDPEVVPELSAQDTSTVSELSVQDTSTVSELSAQDTSIVSELSAQDTSIVSEFSVQDTTLITPELSPEDSPFISTGVSAEVPSPEPTNEVVQQLEPVMVRYSADFQFGDGIYANFDMVLANDPIPPARIVTDLDMFDRAFYEKITAGKQIVIYDENGVKQELDTHEIWGYGRNGILYINVGSAFHRISFVGSICHFVATVTTYNPNYYDPYYYNPYYSSSYYYNRYSMPQSNTASTDLRQYLLDFETGDVMEYDVESVEVLLMKDPELADEFHSLSNRKKKQMKFVYIRKFNERHPLYFPSY